MMMEFLLISFSDVWELQVLHIVSFSLMYFMTLIGNFLIVIATTLDKSLHTPMYFFLRNLSILDACYISVTVPNSCVNFLINNSVISRAGCVVQVFLVIFFVYLEMLFLTIMARDRFVAICQPLHYPVIMNPRVCIQMTVASILSGLVYSGFHAGNTFRLPFCHSNVIHQFFCDIPSLLKLSCSDTFSNEITILISGLVIGGVCFFFIIRSYIHIFTTVLKFPSGADRAKAFSTCIPHILVSRQKCLGCPHEKRSPPCFNRGERKEEITLPMGLFHSSLEAGTPMHRLTFFPFKPRSAAIIKPVWLFATNGFLLYRAMKTHHNHKNHSQTHQANQFQHEYSLFNNIPISDSIIQEQDHRCDLYDL
ncbi:PREDICTED: olfactory receptor 14C36-like [Chrysochloris asiatica]|uniref:Olfactory receptor 14C36-like n=1 Tax=Chrysochloris asiatica TaxID=185453 RepID=A0A9B0X3H9_CHRAS|nr:PREDICTED: olfactory receptor 14C36-like [Chrysochloris asiatica]